MTSARKALCSLVIVVAAALPLVAGIGGAAGDGNCPSGSIVGREAACVPRQALVQLSQVRSKTDQLEKEEAFALPGLMTMWSDSPTTIVGGSCEYANGANGGVASQAASSPYVASKAYCAADSALYAGGAACGNCYRVSYDGSPATDPGRPGSMIVQIVDSGSAKTFDCQVTSFQAITGATTGVFPITYEPVDCETHADGATAMVLDGNNAWYTKVIFSNLPRAVVAAELTVNSKRFPMSRNSGATWRASLDGTTGPASFKVTLQGGGTVELNSCFDGWPVRTGSFCKSNDGTEPSPTPVPTPVPVPTAVPVAALPAWTGVAPWQRVDGGAGRACRGTHSGDNARSYYTLHWGVSTLDACRLLCLAMPSCTGLEHNMGSRRCEIWSRAIQASAAYPGYTCLRHLAPAATPPPSTSPSDWEEVDGASNRACRGASAGDNSASYYTLHHGMATLEDCKALCDDACTGIEFKASSGRCEVWTRAIGASAAVTGYACLRRTAGLIS